MKELGRRFSTEQPRQLDLPAGRREQIVAAHDQRDALPNVVDRGGELIGPKPVTVAHEEVSALLVWTLFLDSMPPVRNRSIDGTRCTRSPSPGAPGSCRSRHVPGYHSSRTSSAAPSAVLGRD